VHLHFPLQAFLHVQSPELQSTSGLDEVGFVEFEIEIELVVACRYAQVRMRQCLSQPLNACVVLQQMVPGLAPANGLAM